jgi:hypothetical protein
MVFEDDALTSCHFSSIDDDGDLVVPRRAEPDKLVIRIQHAMATSLQGVGLQV